jgi:transposase InsO family protein
VLRLGDQHHAWGGCKLRHRLRDVGHADVPAPSTITTVLRGHGRLGPAMTPGVAVVRFEHDAPNRLWQMDFKGHFATAGGDCYALTVLDDPSRFALGMVACGDERDGTVRSHLTALFRRYGLPERVLCDNGPPGEPPDRANATRPWGCGCCGWASALGTAECSTPRPTARTSGSTAP